MQSANIAWNVLLLWLTFLHGTVATTRMCDRKFLHWVLWTSFAKLCTKNCENRSTFVKVTAKKISGTFFIWTGHGVKPCKYIKILKRNKHSNDQHSGNVLSCNSVGYIQIFWLKKVNTPRLENGERKYSAMASYAILRVIVYLIDMALAPGSLYSCPSRK